MKKKRLSNFQQELNKKMKIKMQLKINIMMMLVIHLLKKVMMVMLNHISQSNQENLINQLNQILIILKQTKKFYLVNKSANLLKLKMNDMNKYIYNIILF